MISADGSFRSQLNTATRTEVSHIASLFASVENWSRREIFLHSKLAGTAAKQSARDDSEGSSLPDFESNSQYSEWFSEVKLSSLLLIHDPNMSAATLAITGMILEVPDLKVGHTPNIHESPFSCVRSTAAPPSSTAHAFLCICA